MATGWCPGNERADDDGEVGARLDGLVEHGAVVLHDRRVRGTTTTIGHLVIAPYGLSVVDTNRCHGQVDSSTSDADCGVTTASSSTAGIARTS